VAVTESVADAMTESYGIAREKITVVSNGVDVGRFAETGTGLAREKSAIGNPKSKIGIRNDSFVIGSVGRLAEVKGCDRLIRAFAMLKSAKCKVQGEKCGNEINTQRSRENALHLTPAPPQASTHILTRVAAKPLGEDGYPQLVTPESCSEADTPILLLVGDGPERSALAELAEREGVSDKVIFAGYQDDVAPFYAAMDLFVVPSRSEGLSVALLEAMAAGVPVAVTDVGANREIVDNGKCGILLPDNEANWMPIIAQEIHEKETADLSRRSSGCTGAEADTRSRLRMETPACQGCAQINTARERIRDCYSLDATLSAYEKIYQSVTTA